MNVLGQEAFDETIGRLDALALDGLKIALPGRVRLLGV